MAASAAAAAADDPSVAGAAAQAATLAEWEAEVEKLAAERETARRAKQMALEESLTASPDVTFLTITMATAASTDPEEATEGTGADAAAVPTPPVGYSEVACGVTFNEENNAVVAIAAGGLVERDGRLRIGDAPTSSTPI